MNGNKLIRFTKDLHLILKLVHSSYKQCLPVIVIKSIIDASFPFINIIFSYLIVDALIKRDSKAVITNYIIIMASLNLVFGIASSVVTKINTIITEKMNLIVNKKLAEKSLLLDYEQLETKENMELLQKAKEGALSNGGLVNLCSNLGSLLKELITILYSIIILSSLFKTVFTTQETLLYRFFASPISSLIIILFFILALFLNYRILRKFLKLSYDYFEKNVDSNRKFLYFLNNVLMDYKVGKEIRIFNMHEMILEELKKSICHCISNLEKVEREEEKKDCIAVIINQIVVYITYVIVGVKALLEIISIGSVLKFVSTLSLLNNAINAVIARLGYISIQMQYLKNFLIFLQLENVKYQGQLPIEKRNDNEYEIVFKNVSFHYPNNDELILKNVSLKLNIGKKLAIVGPNGAGKTTFIKLLCRLYDPTHGEILLNGINIKKYDYKEYLQILSVVFQDFKLFSFDVAQNVSASSTYSEDMVWLALNQTGVNERVRKMEHGLQTELYQIEGDGIEISGGEAQKIAIARALYKNAPIVILDEPTAALDPISEYEIYSKFNTLVNQKTAIYISHRMSSCRFCDNIVVFNDGTVSQVGDHDSLMKEENGLYYKLWTAQAKYYNV